MGVRVEEEWRYSKIKSENASKSAFTFKIKAQIKQKERAKSNYGFSKVTPLSREVVVKITGGAYSKIGIKNAIEYISKDCELELTDSNGNTYKSEEEIKEVIKASQKKAIKPDQGKELKLTQNIVFSAPKIAGVTKEDAIQATAKALKEKYPDNYFVMSYHGDTENPHVHVVLNINNDKGRRLDIRKKDLRDLRKGYCKNLVEYGYEVKATRKYETNKFSLKPSQYNELSQSEHTKKEYRNTYEVMDFGTESYQMNDKKTENNFLMYKTSNGKEVIIWGKTLLHEIESKGVKRGDLINIDKTGHEDIKVPVFAKDGETIVGWKSAERNTWNIDKVGSAEERKFTERVKIKQENNQHLKEIKEDVNSEVRLVPELNTIENITPKDSKLKQQRAKVIKLDSSEQAAKHKLQKEKFEHEKKLTLDPEYKKSFEQQQKLEHQLKQKHSYRF